MFYNTLLGRSPHGYMQFSEPKIFYRGIGDIEKFNFLYGEN